jgi:hypothetical protein
MRIGKARSDVGFMDAHVEPVKLEMVWHLKWGRRFENVGPQTRTDGSPLHQQTPKP